MTNEKGWRVMGKRKPAAPVESIVTGLAVIVLALWMLSTDAGWGWWIIAGGGLLIALYGIIAQAVAAGIREAKDAQEPPRE